MGLVMSWTLDEIVELAKKCPPRVEDDGGTSARWRDQVKTMSLDVLRAQAEDMGPRPRRFGQLGRQELQKMTHEEVLAAYESGRIDEIMGR